MRNTNNSSEHRNPADRRRGRGHSDLGFGREFGPGFGGPGRPRGRRRGGRGGDVRAAALLLQPATAQVAVSFADIPAPPIAARAYVLFDASSGQTLAQQAAGDRFEPASLTKLMTAYLVFDALKSRKIDLKQTLPVSERAWKMPGSRMFIDPKMQVPVDDLLKGMIVQSGNDATMALAEGVGGTVENFVKLMNDQAQALGMKGTVYKNPEGLTEPGHTTTARDLATLATRLMQDFPEFMHYYATKQYSYPGTPASNGNNRNMLLFRDPTVDGLKTGHTEAAGYCLVSSAKRGSRRLVSVVLGAASDRARAQESLKLLNFGFQFYDAVQLYAKDQSVSDLRIWKGTEKTLKAGFTSDFILAVPKGYAPRIKTELVSQQPMMAPVTQGQVVGTMKVSIDGKPFGDYPVVAIEGVPVANIFGRAVDTVRLWFN